jgi:peptide/nickel transport system ATP-binding protein
VRAADRVNFILRPRERLGLVGESGSGKSTTGLAIMRMIKSPGRIEGGEVLLDGQNLLTLSEEEMRRVRFAKVSMIPQGAMNSLNPVMRVSKQIEDIMTAHGQGQTQRDTAEHIAKLLRHVGLSPQVAQMFPHELSGGMKQRVCIAMAISLRPRVIIADEPTSALDVVVQRQVMETLRRVQEELGETAVILVGHDMGLMAQFASKVGVMYAGKVAEVGPVRDIFQDPLHPYTRLLISTLPSLTQRGVFKGIPGMPPSLLRPLPGCPFHPRCPLALPRCSVDDPAFREVKTGRWTACHLFDGEGP